MDGVGLAGETVKEANGVSIFNIVSNSLLLVSATAPLKRGVEDPIPKGKQTLNMKACYSKIRSKQALHALCVSAIMLLRPHFILPSVLSNIHSVFLIQFHSVHLVGSMYLLQGSESEKRSMEISNQGKKNKESTGQRNCARCCANVLT